MVEGAGGLLGLEAGVEGAADQVLAACKGAPHAGLSASGGGCNHAGSVGDGGLVGTYSRSAGSTHGYDGLLLEVDACGHSGLNRRFAIAKGHHGSDPLLQGGGGQPWAQFWRRGAALWGL